MVGSGLRQCTIVLQSVFCKMVGCGRETMGLRGLYKVAATAYWLPLPALAKSPLSLIQTVHCRLPSLLPKYHLEVFAGPSITYLCWLESFCLN